MHESPEQSAAPALIASLRELNGCATHLGHAFASSHGIYHTDFRALLLVHNTQREQRQLTSGELAAALALSSGAVTYLVGRLAQAELVERQVDPQDRRKVLLAITPAGQQLIHEHLQPLTDVVVRSLAPYSPEQLQTTLDVLAGVQTALDTHSQAQLGSPTRQDR